MPMVDFHCFCPGHLFDRDATRGRLAQTRLVQLLLYLAVALIVRADTLPIELKALVDQVVAIGLHFLLIDRGGSRRGRIGRTRSLRGPEYWAGLRQQRR